MVLIRDPHDWSVAPVGQTGLLQTLSVLPRSYPGHSLLTEDLAAVCGVDDCPCGRKRVCASTCRGACLKRNCVVAVIPNAFGLAVAETGVETVRQFLPVPMQSANIEAVCPEELFLRRPMAAFDPSIGGFPWMRPPAKF